MQASNMPDAARLKELVGEIEEAEAERAEVAGRIRALYALAKVEGYMVKILKQAIKRRKMTEDERAVEDAALDLYESMLSEFPGERK